MLNIKNELKEFSMENNRKKRIYTITRSDLSIGQKATQSNHASTQYLIDHSPHLKGEWNNGSIICFLISSNLAISSLSFSS